MTLAVSVHGRKTIWLLADRRLTYANGAKKDDAVKIVHVGAQDGNALLGYSGLGRTDWGTEPSDWVVNVLRGGNGPLETGLLHLAEAMLEQFPEHLKKLGAEQRTIVPAIIGKEVRFYQIGVVRPRGGDSFKLEVTRPLNRHGNPYRIAVTGSGIHAAGIKPGRVPPWTREVLRLVAAVERGKTPHSAVSDRLAQLNSEVAKLEPTVGNRCIVVWKNIEGTGGQDFYIDRDCDPAPYGPGRMAVLPAVSGGQDMKAFLKTIMPDPEAYVQSMFTITNGVPTLKKEGEQPQLDVERLNAELAKLPDGPDRKLR